MSPRGQSRSTRRSAGFTLIELMAAVVLTAMVLGFASQFYLDLSRASNAAAEKTRSARRAAVLLDRIATDLEGAVLVRKPDDVDPLEHPWVFVAEPGQDEGADRVKFVTRANRPASDDALESDLEMVAWLVERHAGDEVELLRWSSPHLPESLDRNFPRGDEADVVASDLASFGITFIADEGESSDRWDSSTLEDSAELPLAARVALTLYRDADSDEIEGPFERTVLLPLRPLDLQVLVADARLVLRGGTPDDEEEEQEGEESGDGEESESGDTETADTALTAAQCLALHPELRQAAEAFNLVEVIASLPGPVTDHQARLAPLGVSIPADCL